MGSSDANENPEARDGKKLNGGMNYMDLHELFEEPGTSSKGEKSNGATLIDTDDGELMDPTTIHDLGAEFLKNEFEYEELNEVLKHYSHTRQRALQSVQHIPADSGASVIDFPNGLPPAPRRPKEKPFQVEQQLKKVEVAQRRRLQTEEAAREYEERATNAMTLPSNTVRWLSGSH